MSCTDAKIGSVVESGKNLFCLCDRKCVFWPFFKHQFVRVIFVLCRETCVEIWVRPEGEVDPTDYIGMLRALVTQLACAKGEHLAV